MESGRQVRDSHRMTNAYAPMPQTPTRSAIPPPALGVTLTRADYQELADELHRLRTAYRADLAERLRDARSFGSAGDDDDWLTVMEDATVEQGRIAQLERLVAAARVVEEQPSDDAGAGLGAVVRVRDDAGRTREYELVGRLGPEEHLSQVSLGSPVGSALLGARPGDVVHVTLPNGRERSLSVLEVRGAEPVPA
jgi:transcription elongation factor GreA